MHDATLAGQDRAVRGDVAATDCHADGGHENRCGAERSVASAVISDVENSDPHDVGQTVSSVRNARSAGAEPSPAFVEHSELCTNFDPLLQEDKVKQAIPATLDDASQWQAQVDLDYVDVALSALCFGGGSSAAGQSRRAPGRPGG